MARQALIAVSTGKLLSLHFITNLAQKIRKIFSPIHLNIDGLSVFSDYHWNTSRLHSADIIIRPKKSGFQIRLTKPRDNAFYIIHNALTRHFKKIELAEGVATSDIGNLHIKAVGKCDPTLSCSLVILEFDSNNMRIGSFITPLNKANTYLPSPNAQRSIFCLQFKGIGRCTIHSLQLIKLHDLHNYTDHHKCITTPKDGNFIHNILLELAKSLPTSNGCRHYKRIPLKVGIISDVYMYNFYRDVFDELHYLSPTNYEEILSSDAPDLILYVTCWRGIKNDEWKGVTFRQEPNKALNEIIKKGRELGSKLVFQSIEDPSNFENFLKIARQFDYIFTSDTNTISRYKDECSHDRVFYGEYGINPNLNNPIGCRRHILNAAFFAGSWADRYKERCEDMEIIFDSIRSSGGRLVIADRNHETLLEDHQYPERFQNHIIPQIEHELLQSMHKLFRYNLNFNSIKNSPTMCAMRIYELQAMGVGIISNYARSVFNNFPEIRIIPWGEDLTLDFKAAHSFDEYQRNMTITRNVLNDKTAHEIVSRMLKAIGLEEICFSQPVVCVICDEDNSSIRSNFERQNYPHRILTPASNINTPEKWAKFAKKNMVSYFTWFTSDDEYEDNYLNDHTNAFKYTTARYTTRAAWFDGANFHNGIQHDYTRNIGGKARTLFAADEFSPLEFMDFAPHEIITPASGGYALDPFELNYRRYLEHNNSVVKAKPPRLSVIIPIFNNGRFLRANCIESLKRNLSWAEMEILLIDDGSNDPDTLKSINNLSREHSQIKVFLYEDGGSGSASRPRNKGIELANAPFITFLDPDNEISPGGYDTLLALYEEANKQTDGGIDFISGYHVKVEEQAQIIGKHTSQRLWVADNLKARFLESGKFPVIPTQPAIISRHLFKNRELRFIENSAGQDTLFGWELLCHATSAAFTDAVYLIYYAQRTNSIINTIDACYFEKKKILEEAQSSMLTRHGLMGAYLDHHYDYFRRNWYLPKLAMIEDEKEHAYCKSVLSDIAKLYGQE